MTAHDRPGAAAAAQAAQAGLSGPAAAVNPVDPAELARISALFNDGRPQPEQYPFGADAPYLASRRATRSWSPAAWSSAAHYLDRLLRNRGGHRTAELLALAAHPAQTWSPEVAWLAKHLLLNAPAPLPPRRGHYDRMLTLLPGLSGLNQVTAAQVELPLRLRRYPTGAHPYLATRGIWD